MAPDAPRAKEGEWKALWHQPRRSFTRRAVFQVHLWMGVLLGLYTVVVSVTGSLLVFRPEIEHALRPELFRHVAVSGSPAHGLPPDMDRLLSAVSAQYPGEKPVGIDNLDHPGEPAIVYATTAAHALRMVYVDQQTATVLGQKPRYDGFLGTCLNLHIYLLSGRVGYVVNGGCAIAFLVLCLTGWILWWPGIRSVGRGLRVHWRARWKRLNWDLHSVGGFWSNPLLIVVIATGILFIFPRPSLICLSRLTGGSTAAVDDWLSSPPVPHAATGAALLPLGQALDAARRQLAVTDRAVPGAPEHFVVRYLSLAQPKNAMYQAIAYPQDTADFAMSVHVYLDGYTGATLGVKDARMLPAGARWSTYAYAVHFGNFWGWPTRVLWVLLGLLPVGLWASGLYLWWNRSLRPRFAGRSPRPKGV